MVDVRDIFLVDTLTEVYDLEGEKIEIQKDKSLGIRFRLSLEGEPAEVSAYIKLLREKPVRVVKTMAGDDFLDLVLIIPETGQVLSLVKS